MKKNKVFEDLAELAREAELDHEVQMARSDLYKLAKYSIELYKMLQTVPESKGLEGWIQAKITKASDYISSVYHKMEHEENNIDDLKMHKDFDSDLDYDSGFDNDVDTMSDLDYDNDFDNDLEYDMDYDIPTKFDRPVKRLGEAKKVNQLKGKDKMPKKSKPCKSGEQKHPHRGKLVGEEYIRKLQSRLLFKLNEKAESKAQQRAAGIALSAKRGETPKSKLKGPAKEMMKMSTKELEKYAGTKHKGLPKKKTK